MDAKILMMNDRAPDVSEAEAALWLVRLGDAACDPQAHSGHAKWRSERPGNAAAHAELQAIWDDLGEVANLGFATPRRDRQAQTTRRTRLVPRFTPRVAGVAIALAASIAAIFVAISMPAADIYTTEVGEQRIVTLPDDTRVALNTDSVMEVSYSGDQRVIELDRGEALFEVAHDSSRPFLVRTQQGTVTVLGTRFIVRHDREAVEVALLTGKVSVQPADVRRHPFRIHPGQRIRLGGVDGARVDEPALNTLTAWRRGELVLQGTSISAAVEEMNRYSEKPIVISMSARLSQKTLSGIFRVRETERFARTLAAMYGLDIEIRDDGYYLGET
ncbi:FecR family protein [Pelagerythrobacter marensis]|uniref:FecR protein domain-containing protein n=1 Tax=Pelagerythrobacter marensis TaxID=543877 RepID=A0A0G3X7I6_9SPHN|nr:FecR domain-containing protein [Pelagerythrobacter marensis]AKM06368.1 hypothetical protein AM2010_279 [Pelagerythrobacter marensis]